MIKAVLLDLDDTLVISRTMDMFRAYLEALGVYSARFGRPAEVAHHVMTAYGQALHTYAPANNLMDRFFAEFAIALGLEDSRVLRQFYEEFYVDHYPSLVHEYVRVQQGAVDLLRLLERRGLKIVIATNPVLPEVAAICRLEEGRLSPQEHQYEFITSLENMHFGKPQPEYYEEILFRLDVEPHEALMVGDTWEDDIIPARTAGLNTYWVANDPPLPLQNSNDVDASGTLVNLVAFVESGWLRRLTPPPINVQSFLHRLAAFPATLYTLMEGLSDGVLACSPEDSSWSARDIVCHLRDHEREADRVLLERIVKEDNPFLSGNYVPVEPPYSHDGIDVWQALRQFVQDRGQTVDWLRALPPDAWARKARHAIFGSTTFSEMVRFATEHDRTHHRQMIEALQRAKEICH